MADVEKKCIPPELTHELRKIYELGAYSKEDKTKYSKEIDHTHTPVFSNFDKNMSVYVIK